MAEVTWKTPAPRQRAGAASQTADLLRGKPGNWAIIDEYPAPPEPGPNASPEDVDAYKEALKKVRAKASSRASQIKQGRVPAYRHTGSEPGAFRALARTEVEPDGTRMIRVFAVFLQGQEALDYLAEVEEEKRSKAAKKESVVGDGSGAQPVGATV